MLSVPVLVSVLGALLVTEASPIERSLPDGYLHPKFGQSRANVEKHTASSFDYVVSTDTNQTQLGRFSVDWPGTWVANNGWTAIAQYDAIRGTQRYAKNFHRGNYALKDLHVDCPWDTPFADCYNDDNGWAGLSMVAGWDAYQDWNYLEWAKEIFQFNLEHGYIQQADLDAGYFLNNPNITTRGLQKECDGKSMVGGVAWKNVDDVPINAVSTLNTALLGVELCERTWNYTYCDIARKQLEWVDNHQLNPANNLIWDHINATTCQVTNWTFTYNAGLYIGAYAKLGHLTNDQSAIDKASKTARTSISDTATWNSPNGILMEANGETSPTGDGIEFQAVLIRNLRNSYPYFDKQLRKDILRFIDIQYYGITQLGSDSKTAPKLYSQRWTGPYNQSQFSIHTEISALEVLNGIYLNPWSAFPWSNDKSNPVSKI